MADRQTGQPFYFLLRQGAFVGIGLLAAGIVFQIPVARWRRAGPLLLLTAIALLVLVLIPGIGKEVNGSMRWIGAGPINIQVSEIAKLFALIYVAGYLKRHEEELRTADFRTSALALFRPMVVLAVLAVLLLLEPDFGSVVVLMATALGMVFLAGVNLWQFGALQVGTAAVMVVLILFSPYRLARALSFLDPWANPETTGYQLVHSLIAIGRGELFGVGLGASVEKLFYLPEAHTDFLFAVLAEELGLARHPDRDRPVRDPGMAGFRHRTAGGAAGHEVFGLAGLWHRPVVRDPGAVQHGRQHGGAADQGLDPAADELWR